MRTVKSNFITHIIVLTMIFILTFNGSPSIQADNTNHLPNDNLKKNPISFSNSLSDEGRKALLNFSSYFGGSSNELADEVITDSHGNHIITLHTASDDIELVNPDNATYSGPPLSDVVIAKFSSNWNPMNITYLGGSGSDYINGAHDVGSGYVFIGQTNSPDFPSVNSKFDSTTEDDQDDDVFIAFYDYQMNLEWTDKIGGDDADNPLDSAFDGDDNIYIGGNTRSVFSFPTNESFIPSGSGDCFVMRYDIDDREFEASEYGGDGYIDLNGIVVDHAGDVIVVGNVHPFTEFPTKNAYQSEHAGSDDLFITKFTDGTGSDFSVSWATLFGEYDRDRGNEIAVDSKNNIIVVGRSQSYNLTMENEFDRTLNAYMDGLVVKFDPFGNLIMSTFIGHQGWDNIEQVEVDNKDRIHIISDTESDNFPTKSPFASFNEYGNPSMTYSILSSYPTERYDYQDAEILWSSYLDYNISGRPGSLDVSNDQITIISTSYFDELLLKNPYRSNASGLEVAIQSFYNPIEDHDEDGIKTIDEVYEGSNIMKEDTDGDGMSDEYEYVHGLNLNVDDASGDYDNDGIPNGWEYENGLSASNATDATSDGDRDNLIALNEYTLGLDDTDSDFDNDGLIDGEEVHEYDTDPNKSDTDGDGISDHDELFIYNTDPNSKDSDGDGIDDDEEINSGSGSSRDSNSTSDTDNDSFIPGFEIYLIIPSIITLAILLRRKHN